MKKRRDNNFEENKKSKASISRTKTPKGVKPMSKPSNKKLIKLAIEQCCFPGPVNAKKRNEVLEYIDLCESDYFAICLDKSTGVMVSKPRSNMIEIQGDLLARWKGQCRPFI